MAGSWTNDVTGSPNDGCVISVRGATKRYKLYKDAVLGPLKEHLFFWRQYRPYKEFVAVDTVSLEVNRGEVVGIVGMNGSGKTTLLKMIAGLLPIDDGEIHVQGRITALLALGVGIHPEFSGRENIFYSGLLYGMSEAEVRSKMEDIIQFAELGDFIEQPLRTYSSGMRARLLFSIAMSIDPDILIVDEALATGDSYFVRKSSNRIRELCQSGATILFVSHNLRQVEELCDRAVLLWDGRLVDEGEPSHIVSQYNLRAFEKEKVKIRPVHDAELQMISGTGRVQVSDMRLMDRQGNKVNGFYTGEPMTVELTLNSDSGDRNNAEIFLGFLRDGTNDYVGFFNSTVRPTEQNDSIEKVMLLDKAIVQVALDPLLLTSGKYSLWVILYDGLETLCEYRNVRPFVVSRKDDFSDQYGNYFQPGRCSVLHDSRHDAVNLSA